MNLKHGAFWPVNIKGVEDTKRIACWVIALGYFALFPLSFAASAAVCDFEHALFDAGFDGGRLDACKIFKGKDKEGVNGQHQHFILSVNPENIPINPSPWYAFSASSKGLDRIVSISIVANHASPRYVPKISKDRQLWTPIDFSVDQDGLHFNLALSSTPLYVAAQELIVEQDYQNWMQQEAIRSLFTLEQVGISVEKRPIYGLVASQPDNKEWLLVIGRQHPPEITGALALFAFVNQLASSAAVPQAFFKRFNVLVVPMLNPDGVAAGNWRHNKNGIDLNRDWGKFTQPETLSTFTYLNALLRDDHRLVFAVDFHSTQQDIFYTMPSDYRLAPADFAERWIAQLKDQRISSFTVRERPGSSPGGGVFKQFIADHYGVHAVTYEIGDNTDRKLIDHIAQKSAEILMQQMLATPVDAFIPKPAKLTVD